MPRNTQSTMTSQNSNNNDTDTPVIDPAAFDIARLGFSPLPSTSEQTQLISIPRYLYDMSKKPTKENIEQFGKQLVIVTEPIKLSKGGPANYNEKYHGSNPDSVQTAYFFIPYIETDAGSNLLFSVINQIDEYMENEINTKKNKQGILETFKSADRKTRIPVNGIRYTEMAKLLEPAVNGKEFEPYKRLKVKFSSGAKYDKNRSQKYEETRNETFLVDTQIYVGDEPDPKDCKTLSDVRQYFKWGCTAQFALVFNKLWALKSGEKKCGISAKCVQMRITEQSPDKTQGITMQFKSSLFSKQKPEAKQAVINTKTKDSDDDDDDEEPEQVVNKKTKDTKNSNDDDNDDDDDDDDDNDNNDNDDDEEEEKSEQDSDDEPPAKKQAAKPPTKQESKKPEPKKSEPVKTNIKQSGKR